MTSHTPDTFGHPYGEVSVRADDQGAEAAVMIDGDTVRLGICVTSEDEEDIDQLVVVLPHDRARQYLRDALAMLER